MQKKMSGSDESPLAKSPGFLDKVEFNIPNFSGMLQDEELTAERISDCQKAFKIFDKKGKGKITAKNLIGVMRNLGMNATENEIEKIMAELDINANGKVELHEFVNVMLDKMQELDTEDEIKKVFEVFDRDGNGYINPTELRYFMNTAGGGNTMTEEEVDQIFQDADIDGDGQLDYDEFVKMLVS